MNRRSLLLSSLAGAAGLAASVMPALAQGKPEIKDRENTLIMTLKNGDVYIELFPDVAPKTVAQIKTLTRQGFYDGTPFHRVIEGFMAQGGDPTGTGTGGSKLPNVPAEFSQMHFVRGVLGMARTNDPNSGNSQFFIMFAPAPSLDGKYTIFGRVIGGMQYVDQIKRGDASDNGAVKGQPDRILKMRVAADVK
ncbi:peptidylprolyl isomerase [Rhodopila sp.]|jgi:peptidylprolyl isomerase|uniref:peptidylprolyl isomerase n=1 Tax=Rhodopila sp. TaxID=2480087 RepID=UPI002D02BC74|nr:peptidylprolyl isomerase [Rhodopila sp.]HVZ08812.1 peptidylprolyl isomerase [Rhodopila sp.]